MTTQTKIYKSLDIAKLLCACLIIFIHTYCFEPWGIWIKCIICPLAVPFFFITSGFFLEKGMRSNDKKEYIKHYFLRIFSLYCVWTLLTLPVSWMTISRGHPDYSIVLRIIYLVREFFFSGSLGIYWYLLCLLYGCVIIYWLDKFHALKWGMIAALALFVYGIILNCGIGWNTLPGRMIHVVFGSTRNPFNEGIFYMLIGFGISRTGLRLSPYLSGMGVLLSGIIAYSLFVHTSVQVMQLFMAFFLFLLVLEIDVTTLISDRASITARRLSTALYLIQFPFILVFDFYLQRSTIIDYSATLAFCLVAYTLSSLLLPKRVNKLLYG